MKSFRNWFFQISEAEAKCDEILAKLKEIESDMNRVETKIIAGRRAGSDVSEYEQIYAQYIALRTGLVQQLNYWVKIFEAEQR